MKSETETETDEEMEMEEEEEEPLVFEVSEIDLEYEFDAARWHDFTREELETESRLAQLWFQTAQSYPPSPFALKLLRMEEQATATDVRGESDRDIAEQPALNETATGVNRSGVFTFIHGATLDNVPNQSLHDKGPTLHSDKLKCRSKPSTRPIPRSSTLLKPTASQLAKQESIRLQKQLVPIKDKGLCHSSISEVQASKRQKLDGGLLRKVAEKKQEINLVHKALKKDKSLDRDSHHAKTKITTPHEPHFATSHRIRHKDDAKLDQDSKSEHRFKARPFNRKIFEAPSLPIRKKSTPKLPEFQEFHLKTSERAMQHSSVATALSDQGNNDLKGSDKPDTTAFLDGVNRELRRPRALGIPKDNDRKHISKARPPDNKVLSIRRDTGIFRKSKRETAVPLEFGLQSEVQPDLPTDLFSKLSLSSELQQNNGSRLRVPQPEQVKGSKDNNLKSFQAGNERTSKAIGKPLVQRGVWTVKR